ncbi:MAG: hypothetical protein QNJ53_04145 [Pleurocapsa sp. MO_192.B19]|nr:hypothetical protein [Pleurocapsa sp. MO_192.B19]
MNKEEWLEFAKLLVHSSHKAELEKAMVGHILEQAELLGVYQKF